MLEDFKKMVLPTQHKLFRFALRMLGNTAEAEDVVQEVFIKVWDKRADLTKLQNVEAWCMKLTKNLSLDKIKSKHRQIQMAKVETDVVSSGQSPAKALEATDTLSQVGKIMEALPQKQKMVMQLRDIEGYSYQEIAEMLEMPLNQVKVYLHRARTQVREKLIKAESYGI